LSDDELADGLSALFRHADPVPAAVRDAAAASLTWRDPDAALAALVQDTADSDAMPVTSRGAVPRLLTFEADELVIDVEINIQPDGVRLTGQLAPMRAATITVCRMHAQQDVRADALGRFAVAGLPHGLVRLRCARGAAVPVNTEWFAI
jgi:hypothetical protein